MRIPVATVVGMVADGMSESEILAAYPYLEPEDVREGIRYAAEAVRERELPHDTSGCGSSSTTRASRVRSNAVESGTSSGDIWNASAQSTEPAGTTHSHDCPVAAAIRSKSAS